jgi:hypothetical protein
VVIRPLPRSNAIMTSCLIRMFGSSRVIKELTSLCRYSLYSNLFNYQDENVKTFMMTMVPLKSGIVRIPKVEIEVLTPNVLSEVEDASIPDITVLPIKFTAVYKVEVPEMLSQDN